MEGGVQYRGNTVKFSLTIYIKINLIWTIHHKSILEKCLILQQQLQRSSNNSKH